MLNLLKGMSVWRRTDEENYRKNISQSLLVWSSFPSCVVLIVFYRFVSCASCLMFLRFLQSFFPLRHHEREGRNDDDGDHPWKRMKRREIREEETLWKYLESGDDDEGRRERNDDVVQEKGWCTRNHKRGRGGKLKTTQHEHQNDVHRRRHNHPKNDGMTNDMVSKRMGLRGLRGLSFFICLPHSKFRMMTFYRHHHLSSWSYLVTNENVWQDM